MNEFTEPFSQASEELRARLLQKYPLADTLVTISGHAWKITSVDLEDLLQAVGPNVERDSFPHGLLLWPAAFQIAERLAAQPEMAKGRRVLEIGSGVGLPGLVAQSLGACVTQTDYMPEPLTLTRLNALQNGIDGILTFLADWHAFPQNAQYDLVLGSDVLYKSDLRPTLAALLEQVMAPGGSILFADRIPAQAGYFADRLRRGPWQAAVETCAILWEGETRDIALLFADFTGSGR